MIAGLLLLSCGIFYFCDTIILPINTVLDIIKSHEHGTLCVFGKGKTLGNAVVAKVQPSEHFDNGFDNQDVYEEPVPNVTKDSMVAPMVVSMVVPLPVAEVEEQVPIVIEHKHS